MYIYIYRYIYIYIFITLSIYLFIYYSFIYSFIHLFIYFIIYLFFSVPTHSALTWSSCSEVVKERQEQKKDCAQLPRAEERLFQDPNRCLKLDSPTLSLQPLKQRPKQEEAMVISLQKKGGGPNRWIVLIPIQKEKGDWPTMSMARRLQGHLQ